MKNHGGSAFPHGQKVFSCGFAFIVWENSLPHRVSQNVCKICVCGSEVFLLSRRVELVRRDVFKRLLKSLKKGTRVSHKAWIVFFSKAKCHWLRNQRIFHESTWLLLFSQSYNCVVLVLPSWWLCVYFVFFFKKQKPCTAPTSGERSTGSALQNVGNFYVNILQNHPHSPM